MEYEILISRNESRLEVNPIDESTKPNSATIFLTEEEYTDYMDLTRRFGEWQVRIDAELADAKNAGKTGESPGAGV